MTTSLIAILFAVSWVACYTLSYAIYNNVLNKNSYHDDDFLLLMFAPLALVLVLIGAIFKGIYHGGDWLLGYIWNYVSVEGGTNNIFIPVSRKLYYLFNPSARKLYEMERDYEELLKLIEYKPKPDSYWKIKELEWELNNK